ncbi:hypothetical protein [Streptomyces sp. DH8]|uniref:hypothetical protein n=1 Tax=Streptomyces sp. DH8 TaxID=2857008 RepID=UPI001E594C9A|nr:hypothetical protein [Streptomyces sp. DH8]
MTFTPRNWAAGEVVTAALLNQEIRDQLNSMFDAWTPYTPTWTSSGTNPVLNNGTATGRYLKIGRTCYVSVLITTGSTTTYGSGTYAFGLPFPSANAGVVQLGVARVSGASATWIGQCHVNAGASTAGITTNASATNAAGSNITPTSPETWAAGAAFRFSLTYQTAT